MSSCRIELNTAFQFEWAKNFLKQILRIILKSFAFTFLLFSSDVMNLCKPLQTNRHFHRLWTSNLIRMFSVMCLNPWFPKKISNILDFVLILVLSKRGSMGKWPTWGPLTWNPLQNSLAHPFSTWVRARARVLALPLTNTLHGMAEDCQTFDFLGVPLQVICDSKIMGAITKNECFWKRTTCNNASFQFSK